MGPRSPVSSYCVEVLSRAYVGNLRKSHLPNSDCLPEVARSNYCHIYGERQPKADDKNRGVEMPGRRLTLGPLLSPHASTHNEAPLRAYKARPGLEVEGTMYHRFHDSCDRCGVHSEEYSRGTLPCDVCGRDVCVKCAVDFDPDPPGHAMCKECEPRREQW